MIWKINQNSYIFASLHHGISKYEIHPKVWHALRKCDTVVFENDSNNNAEVDYVSDVSLETNLGRLYWQKVIERLGKEMSIKIKYVELWVLGMLLAYRENGYGEGVEAIIRKKARTHKIKSLEDISGVVDILRKLFTLELVQQFLDSEAITNWEIVRLYKTANIEKLKQYSKNIHPEIKQELIIKRNHSWLPRMEKHLQNGNVFIAVGAFHLVGEQNVLILLEEKGYSVTRVL